MTQKIDPKLIEINAATEGQALLINNGEPTFGNIDTGGAITVYATTDDIPSSGSTGDMAFVTSTGRLLVYASSQWFSVVMANATPVISGNDATYQLATDGTATVITLTSVDPEGADITWSYTTSGLDSEATISQSSNVFTITPSTNTGNGGQFSITFRASDGVNLGTSTSVFKLNFLVPLYFPNANEGFYVDFTETTNMYTDTSATYQVTNTGDNVSAVRQLVDLGGSASYLISDLAGDTDGSYTSELPTLGNDGTRYFVDITADAAFRVPTVVGDLQNCIFCISARNFNYSDSNSRMFTMESPSITGTLQIGIEGASGQLFCRLAGTTTTFSVDSTNGITLNSSAPSLITVVIQNGVATFRENGVDLGNSGSGGPTANNSIGCALGGGYQSNAYNTSHDTYGALFAYGTFSSSDIDAIEATIAGLAGITL